MGVTIPVPTAAATRPTATTMDVTRADDTSSMSVATSNANMSSGAMVTGAIAVTTAAIRVGATAVTTAIIRTVVIDPGRGPGATVTAVSGVAGQRRISTDTNGPDMRSHRGRQRRVGTEATTATTKRVPIG